MRIVLLVLLVAICGAASIGDKPSACDCVGVHSVSFQYTGDEHAEVRVVLYGQASPSELNHIERGTIFDVDGTYGPEGLLGPANLKIHLFTQYGSNDHFEEHVFKLLKCSSPKVGEQYGSLLVTKIVRRWASPTCELNPVSESIHVEKRDQELVSSLATDYVLPCHLKVAIVVDVSNDTLSSEAIIKGMINSEIVDHLSGKTVHVAIYCFATTAVEVIGYTSVESSSGTQAVKSAVDDIVFAPGGYVDWEEALTLVRMNRPSDDTPDLVLMLTSGNPTTHINGPYVYGEYEDDLAAAIDAAARLKAPGATRIIAIGVGTDVSVNALQAISGPRINDDYFAAEDYSQVQSVLHGLFHTVCCPEDKDACGVCFGDGSSCSGCNPHSGHYLEYDACGVCGGNGSSCSVPTCTHDVTLSVHEETWFDIIAHDEDYGLFEFIYHTNFIANSGVVLGFDSYQECSPRLRGSCDNRPKSGHYGSSTQSEVPLCDLFQVDHPDENPFNGWDREIDFHSQTVWYRRNFTLSELVECKGPDGAGGLIHVTEETGSHHYRGVFYGTVIKLPHDVNCPSHDHYAPYPEPCETALISTHYNFEIWVRSGGELYATLMVSKLDIEPKWLGNVWLQSGDVVVRFSTLVKKDGAKLVGGVIVSEQETGAIPFHLIDGNVACDGEQGECEQIWEIRSYGGVGVLDFSGNKPVRFNIDVNGEIHGTALVNIDLVIKRHSDPLVDNQLGAWINVYHANDHDHRYTCIDHDDVPQQQQQHYGDTSEPFCDNDPVYVKVGLYQHSYKFVVKRIVLCTGKEGELSPYDPNYPESSGCNTPNVDMHTWVLYDKYEDYSHTSGFNFTFVHDDVPWESGFCFNARILFDNKQMLHVDWEVEPLAHSLTPHVMEGEDGVLRLLEPQATLPFAGSNDAQYVKRAKELHRVLYSQRKHFDSYHFNYPQATYIRPSTAEFMEMHSDVFAAHLKQEGHREDRLAIEHFVGGADIRSESMWANDDDDDTYGPYDYYYHDNNPVTSVNQQCFVVHCPDGYSYLRQSCVHNTVYTYYGYTGGLSWWWFLVVLVLVCVFSGFSYLFSGDDTHQHQHVVAAALHTPIVGCAPPAAYTHGHHHHHHHHKQEQHPLAQYSYKQC